MSRLRESVSFVRRRCLVCAEVCGSVLFVWKRFVCASGFVCASFSFKCPSFSLTLTGLRQSGGHFFCSLRDFGQFLRSRFRIFSVGGGRGQRQRHPPAIPLEQRGTLTCVPPFFKGGATVRSGGDAVAVIPQKNTR